MTNPKLYMLASVALFAAVFASLYVLFGYTLGEWDSQWWPAELRFINMAAAFAGPAWIFWNNR